MEVELKNWPTLFAKLNIQSYGLFKRNIRTELLGKFCKLVTYNIRN